MPPGVSRALRLLVALAIFAALLWRSNPALVGRALAEVSPVWIAAAIALVLVDRALMAYRWIALLTPLTAGTRPPTATLLRIFFVSTFVGTFLPASIGSDAVRAWSLARDGVAKSESIASVLMDRLLGVIGILVMAAAGLMLAPEVLALDGPIAWMVIAAAVAGVAGSAIGLAAVFSARAGVLITRAIGRLRPGRVSRGLTQLVASLRAYRHHHGMVGAVLAASVGVQVLRILQAWMLGLSLGMPAPLVTYFAFVPVILLIMLLPISINGIGTSQLAFQALFGFTPEAFALSVLFVALGTVGNLPGALLYAFGGARPAGAARA